MTMRVILRVLVVMTLMMGFSPLRESGVLIHRLIVQPSSKLTIDGSTNINPFQCAITKYFGSDTLVLVESKRRKPVFTKGYVGLSASSFDCGMQLMTNDFAQTIKAKQYPFVSIEFISFERIPRFEFMEDKFKGRLKISLAGVSKPYNVDCTIEAEKSGLIHLRGGRDFTFSDFNLVAPSKMLGLVKVNEALRVNFHLVLLLDVNA